MPAPKLTLNSNSTTGRVGEAVKVYAMKLNNMLIKYAYDTLSVGELYTYVHLIFALKNGISATESKRYCLNFDQIFEAMKRYGYTKSRKTFERHKGVFFERKLINQGKDLTEFLDVIHKASRPSELNFDFSILESFYSFEDLKRLKQLMYDRSLSINTYEFSEALRTFGQQEMKGYIGYKLYEDYFAKAKTLHFLKSKARLEKKVLRFGNRKTFYKVRSKIKRFAGQNGNHEVCVLDQLKLILSSSKGQNGNHYIQSKPDSLKENKPVKASLIDFKGLNLNMGALNQINSRRKKQGKPTYSLKEFQRFIDEMSWAIKQGVLKVKNAGGLFYTHFLKRKITMLTDEMIRAYNLFLDTGLTEDEVKRSESGFNLDLNHIAEPKAEPQKQTDLQRWQSGEFSPEIKAMAREELVRENSGVRFIYEQIDPKLFEVSGLYKHLVKKALDMKEASLVFNEPYEFNLTLAALS